MKKTINWGIIGCGDVAERKSGPAFQNVKGSKLLAVMRRDAAKAKDFAKRHNVLHWYDSAEALLAHPEINAIYVATPPSTHLDYALAALKAGKDVYLEKPMAMDSQEAKTIVTALEKSGQKLAVAHYRRQMPAFLKVKELLENKAIGQVLFVDIKILQGKKSSLIAKSESGWRLNPSVSGGGYFYDLAPHQLDLMIYFFGECQKAMGFSAVQNPEGEVTDVVNGILCFENKVQVRGLWSFNVSEEDQEDKCTIMGTTGKIEFSFFGDQVLLSTPDGKERFTFDNLPHVQQPMIAATVDYFLGKGENPCTAEEGLRVMELMGELNT